jgi:hypothetical protein
MTPEVEDLERKGLIVHAYLLNMIYYHLTYMTLYLIAVYSCRFMNEFND